MQHTPYPSDFARCLHRLVGCATTQPDMHTNKRPASSIVASFSPQSVQLLLWENPSGNICAFGNLQAPCQVDSTAKALLAKARVTWTC